MKKVMFFFAMLGLLTAAPLYASKVKSGENVTISEPVDGNLYLAGGDVRINAPIDGDLVCAGGDVWVNEPIADDIILLGGEARIQNKIGGDVRLAGGELFVEADIAGDLVIAGGELTIREGVTIAGDVFIAGGKVVFDGAVQGDMNIAGGEVIFNGKVEGKMITKGGKIFHNGEVRGAATLAAEELNLGAKAAFYSPVEYWNETGNANFEGHLHEGATATYNEDLKFKTRLDREIVKRGMLGFAIFRLLSAALLMSLLIALFHRFFEKNGGDLKEHVGQYLGYGSIFLVGLPFVIALAFVTVIGIPIGFIMLGGYGIGLVLANSLTAVVAAYEIKKYLKRDWNKGILILISVAMFVALRMIGMLAFPGKLVVFVATAIALGAVIAWLRRGWQKANDTPNDMPGAGQDSLDTV